MSELVELMSLNAEFGTMRYAYIEGDVYFVGKDAASLLEYSDTDQALRKHVSFENSTTRRIDGSSFSDGKSRDAKFINEAGFYQLSMKSKMPKASELQNWISNEVLPSLRKEGQYNMNGTTNPFFDTINEAERTINGNDRDKLRQKIELYSRMVEVPYPYGWKYFCKCFKNKTGIDIKRSLNKYKRDNGIHTLSTPEYLEKIDALDTAFEVINEMIEKKYKCEDYNPGEEYYDVMSDNEEARYELQKQEIEALRYRNTVINQFYATLENVKNIMTVRMQTEVQRGAIAVRFNDIPYEWRQFISRTDNIQNPFVINYPLANQYLNSDLLNR